MNIETFVDNRKGVERLASKYEVVDLKNELNLSNSQYCERLKNVEMSFEKNVINNTSFQSQSNENLTFYIAELFGTKNMLFQINQKLEELTASVRIFPPPLPSSLNKNQKTKQNKKSDNICPKFLKSFLKTFINIFVQAKL